MIIYLVLLGIVAAASLIMETYCLAFLNERDAVRVWSLTLCSALLITAFLMVTGWL